MNLFSTKILKGLNEQMGDNNAFEETEDICVDIYLESAVFRMCFILEEDEDLLMFVATDSEGREKIKVVNKNFIQSVEICYLDDELSAKVEQKIDDMFN